MVLMANIYIVRKSTGSYDDYSISNLAAFTVREDAENYIVEQKALELRRYGEEIVLAEFAKEYIQQNPYPAYPRRIPYPVWPKGMNSKDITPEMRAERQAIIDENKRNSVKLSEDTMEYSKKLLEVQQAFAIGKNFLPIVYYVMYAHAPDKDDHWDIEEMELQ